MRPVFRCPFILLFLKKFREMFQNTENAHICFVLGSRKGRQRAVSRKVLRYYGILLFFVGI